jgi:hypothetical protein
MTTTTTAPGNVAQAERELTETAGAVTAAETQLASGGRSIGAGTLNKLRDAWRHADLTAQGARQKAERDRLAARLDGLGQIGTEVDKLAADAGGATSELADALQAVALACARVRTLATAHDGAVAALVAAANDLGAEPMAPAGPRSTSAFVAVRGTSIVHKRTQVSPVGDRVARALAQAVAGDPVSAITDADAVTQRPEARRASYHFRGGNGLIHTFDNLTDGIQAQVRSGDLKPLTESEIIAYMEGTLA